MKSKKAIKRLTRVEKLLAEVESHYSAIEKPLGKLLSSAKASIEEIKSAIARSLRSKPARSKKPRKVSPPKKKAVKKAAKKAEKKSAKKSPKKAAVKRPTPAAQKRTMVKPPPAVSVLDPGSHDIFPAIS
jgi:ElaB/YqjD/DUF883 family membrane-anchored ribosome-binding protein